VRVRAKCGGTSGKWRRVAAEPRAGEIGERRARPLERAREAARVPGIVEGVLEKVGDLTAITGPARIDGRDASGDMPAELGRSGCRGRHVIAPAR